MLVTINVLMLFRNQIGTPHRGSGIHAVTSLKRHRRLRVIQSKSRAAAYPLPRSLSTLDMSFLSAKGFCCPYPGPTSEGWGLLNMHHTDFGTDTSIPLSPSTDGSVQETHWVDKRDNKATVLPVHLPMVKKSQFIFIRANDCYYNDCHEHFLDKQRQRVAEQRWTEGQFTMKTGELSHSLCPSEIRSFTDECCLTVAFLGKDLPKDSFHDPIFSMTHHNVLPNDHWTVEWRLGGFQKYMDGRLEITAGWTRTELIVDGISQHLRVVLHIPDHRAHLNDELINDATNWYGEDTDWELIGAADEAFEDVEFLSDASDGDNGEE